MHAAHRTTVGPALATLLAVGLASCNPDAPAMPDAPGALAHGHSSSFVTLSPPGNIQSQAWGIDPLGRMVVGAYRTEDAAVHGYVFARGAFTTIDYPGVSFSLSTAINGRGEIVGWWEDADGVQHGYDLQHGVFTTVDVPEAPSTRILGINASGDIV